MNEERFQSGYLEIDVHPSASGKTAVVEVYSARGAGLLGQIKWLGLEPARQEGRQEGRHPAMSRIEDSAFAEMRWDVPEGMLETPESLARRIALTVTLDMEMHAVISGEVVELEQFMMPVGQCGCRCHGSGGTMKHMVACCHPTYEAAYRVKKEPS